MDWFTSDTHFRHAKIVKYCTQPFASCEEKDDSIIDSINTLVQPSDTLWHLGDFVWGGRKQLEYYRNRIKCRRVILIKGNHDKQSDTVYRDVFQGVFTRVEITVKKQQITLHHFEQACWDKEDYGTWHLYGHYHGAKGWNPHKQSFDVGVDPMGYKPISFDQVAALMATKQWQPTDHHRKN